MEMVVVMLFRGEVPELGAMEESSAELRWFLVASIIQLGPGQQQEHRSNTFWPLELIAFASTMADSWTWSEGSKMKLCFVTTGATAPFTDLIRSVLQLSSIDALRAAGYTHLLVQYGVAKDVFDSFVLDARSHVQAEPGKGELVVGGMGFKQEGLREEFLLVQQSRGLVISHAGMLYGTLGYIVPDA